LKTAWLTSATRTLRPTPKSAYPPAIQSMFSATPNGSPLPDSFFAAFGGGARKNQRSRSSKMPRRSSRRSTRRKAGRKTRRSTRRGRR
jgi:hypothetical protein